MAFWRSTVSTDRFSILITSWNKITGAIKRRINASQHFRSFWAAWRTIAGYEAIHMIRKGQACWSARVGLLQRFILDLFAATS
jgi:transposase-like protein